MHGNIVVVVVVAVVIKRETFSALVDNHIIIIIYIYIVIKLLLRETRTHYTHIITILHYDAIQPVQSLGNIRHIVLRDRNTVIN